MQRTGQSKGLTPNPSPQAGDLHFPRKLCPLCIASFRANIEILTEQTAASAIHISRPNPPIAQPKLQTREHCVSSSVTHSPDRTPGSEDLSVLRIILVLLRFRAGLLIVGLLLGGGLLRRGRSLFLGLCSSRMTTQSIRQDTSTRMNRQTSTMAAVTRNLIILLPHFKIVLTCDRYIKTDPRPRP